MPIWAAGNIMGYEPTLCDGHPCCRTMTVNNLRLHNLNSRYFLSKTMGMSTNVGIYRPRYVLHFPAGIYALYRYNEYFLTCLCICHYLRADSVHKGCYKISVVGRWWLTAVGRQRGQSSCRCIGAGIPELQSWDGFLKPLKSPRRLPGSDVLLKLEFNKHQNQKEDHFGRQSPRKLPLDLTC